MANERGPPAGDVTALLRAWADGDASALDALLPHLERELHRLASHHMRGERPGHTLQPTALVNEAYLRLVSVAHVQWRNRTHFLSMAARMMRRILVDLARAKAADKRGGRAPMVPLDEVDVTAPGHEPDVLALHDALDALGTIDARKARVVELRYFGGLTVEETADVVGVAPETVMRDWAFARVWLMRELDAPKGASQPGD